MRGKNILTWVCATLAAAALCACTQSSVNNPVQPPPTTSQDTVQIINGYVLNGCGFKQDTFAFNQVDINAKRTADPTHIQLDFSCLIQYDSVFTNMTLSMTIPTDTGSFLWQDNVHPYGQQDPMKINCALNLYDLELLQPPISFVADSGHTHITQFNKISGDSLTIAGVFSGIFMPDLDDTLTLRAGVFKLNFH